MLIGIKDEETMLFGVHFQVDSLSAKKWELRACQLPHCIIAGDLQSVGILDNRDHPVLSGHWLQVFRSFAFVIL